MGTAGQDRGSASGGGEAPAPDRALRAFERRIAHHEDLLYGVALFFECLTVLYAGQDALLETHRKQIRNIIQTGKDVTSRATALLEEARRDSGKIPGLGDFAFPSVEGDPHERELMQRADVLCRCYRQLFAGRPREQPFTEEETLRLMGEAGRVLERETAWGTMRSSLHQRVGPPP